MDVVVVDSEVELLGKVTGSVPVVVGVAVLAVEQLAKSRPPIEKAHSHIRRCTPQRYRSWVVTFGA